MNNWFKRAVLLIAMLPSLALAEVAVIVNPANANVALDKDQLTKIFLGKKKSFPDGAKAVPLDQAEGSATRTAFYNLVTNKDESQLKAYWSRMIFTGKGTPPKAVGGDADVVSFVAGNAGAVGYVDAGAVNDSVKVVAKF